MDGGSTRDNGIQQDGNQPILKAVVARRAALKASGAFKQALDLAGVWGPPRTDITAGELDATIREAATEWEAESDELLDS